MKSYKFGVMPKKKVTIDDSKVTIKASMLGSGEISVEDIEIIFHKEPTMLENGEVYLSPDGNNTDNPLGQKTGFIYTKKQREDIDEFLSELSELSDDITLKEGTQTKETPKKRKKIKDKSVAQCPKCLSTDVEFMDNKKKGFSVGKAVAGTILTGGVGSLAGFAGKKGKDRFHCQECGNVFTQKIK